MVYLVVGLSKRMNIDKAKSPHGSNVVVKVTTWKRSYLLAGHCKLALDFFFLKLALLLLVNGRVERIVGEPIGKAKLVGGRYSEHRVG